MTVSLYMDHHVPKAITIGLRLRGIDILTSYEDGTDQLDDNLLLKRAHELKRVLFTQDDDLQRSLKEYPKSVAKDYLNQTQEILQWLRQHPNLNK